MQFSTKVNIPTADFSISHRDGILLLGSCFTENISHYLKQYQFKVNNNPFGIIYNPISLFENIRSIAEKRVYTAQDVLLHKELYISLEHHGSFSNVLQETILTEINQSIEKAHKDFTDASIVIFTLGTAFIYRHIEQNRVVANCHKISGTAFLKELLSVEAIKTAYESIENFLKNKTVLFTVSPVRHWRYGASENQRSKSILIESIHQIIEENSNCHYFPAYEIVMDELRDYRFYEEDMIHPNKVAVKYIWQRFGETFFDEKTQFINNRIHKIQHLLQHRIKHENTKEHRDFEAHIRSALAAFKKDFPEIETYF